MRIEPMDPALPAARRLIEASDAFMTALYPAESNHLESIVDLGLPSVYFLGAFDGHVVVGCGAVKTLRDDGVYGEIKRVFVDPAHRGRGISKLLMRALEAHLCNNGVRWVRLETGIRQPEAIALYRRLGYVERPPYGSYRIDPLSLFMEKDLTPEAHAL